MLKAIEFLVFGFISSSFLALFSIACFGMNNLWKKSYKHFLHKFIMLNMGWKHDGKWVLSNVGCRRETQWWKAFVVGIMLMIGQKWRENGVFHNWNNAEQLEGENRVLLLVTIMLAIAGKDEGELSLSHMGKCLECLVIYSSHFNHYLI